MTEHEKGAEKFAESLGGIEGKTKPLDKYEQRERERHEIAQRAAEAQISFHNAFRADAELAAEAKRLALQRHPADVRRTEHADEVWEQDVKDARAHRAAGLAISERQTAAWESIAASLEKLVRSKL